MLSGCILLFLQSFGVVDDDDGNGDDICGCDNDDDDDDDDDETNNIYNHSYSISHIYKINVEEAIHLVNATSVVLHRALFQAPEVFLYQ